MEYPNFFEHVNEANMRLQSTVVVYNGEPVEVLVVTSQHIHAEILMAYLRRTGMTAAERMSDSLVSQIQNYHPTDYVSIGSFLEQRLKDNPDCGVFRVPMSSSGFNRFRPFELGMYWADKNIVYVERQPNRAVYQGLTNEMLVTRVLTLDSNQNNLVRQSVDLYGPEMIRCIKGEHPNPIRCLEALKGNNYANQAAAFHRHFAFVRGAIGSLFLAYKSDIIGYLPHSDFSRVNLGEEFGYCKEVVEDLNLFSTVTI